MHPALLTLTPGPLFPPGPARPGQHGGVPVAVPGVRGYPRPVGDARRRRRPRRGDPRPWQLVRCPSLGELSQPALSSFADVSPSGASPSDPACPHAAVLAKAHIGNMLCSGLRCCQTCDISKVLLAAIDKLPCCAGGERRQPDLLRHPAALRPDHAARHRAPPPILPIPDTLPRKPSWTAL